MANLSGLSVMIIYFFRRFFSDLWQNQIFRYSLYYCIGNIAGKIDIKLLGFQEKEDE